ncbi:MAG: hypothetical protein GF381_03165 [Candidatus Pacebacteria bacterium]|nr:hypothetical protein [Candidatus Paceibacterota bacterium]
MTDQTLIVNKDQDKIEQLLNFPHSKQIKYSLLSTLFLLGLTLVSYHQLTPQIPLLYSLADPEKQLVAKFWIWTLPGLSLMINLVHLVLLKAMPDLERFVLNLFSWSTLILQLILLAISLRIILIVI